MKENIYDNADFFERYGRMDRSVKGLDGAGEWYQLRSMLPGFGGKRVLDLGCGYGWHCRYAIEQGASAVTGVDISEKMIARAREINASEGVRYVVSPLEELELPECDFDIIISSLTFHYLASFEEMVRKIKRWLKPGGCFVFSAEHPVFTAEGKQDWVYGEHGERLHWPVDNYFDEGPREAVFLGTPVVKYHRTLTGYIQPLLANGFLIKDFAEARPDPDMKAGSDTMKDEFRRPMIFMISAARAD